jgi:type III restriction enzyme
MVGLRPYKAASQILPEQTLGRGLRRMFRGQPVTEKVSVVGTDAFMDFVESIRSEGVDLEYAEMGERSRPKAPLVVEVDRENPKKDIDRLDIELPILAPRIFREYLNLDDLDADALPRPKLPIKMFSAEEQREIVFKDLNTNLVSHTTVLDSAFTPSHQSAVGFFARTIMRDLRLVGGFEVLFGKLKEFMQAHLFERRVDLDDLNVLRNLSEIEVTRAILETFKTAVNALTVQDRGTTEIRDTIKLSKTRPFVVNDQPYVVPKRSIFNKVVGNAFELEFGAFLDGCDDIIAFGKNTQSTGFRIEYRTADGGIANYYPDFIVKETECDIWVIETKGREDLEDPRKWERLCQWCVDASAKDGERRFRSLFVRQEQWEQYHPKTFKALCAAFAQS